MNAKENYMMLLRGEIPEWVPSMAEDRAGRFTEDLLTPQSCPDGPIVTALGVTYVGCADMMNGAMPAPGKNLLGEDIRHWRDVIHAPDLSHFDWEKYYKEKTKDIDRSTKYVTVGGGDYFLTLVSFMGFENLLMNLYEEPEEIHAMLDYVHQFYLTVLKNQIYYTKPEVVSIMDDDSSEMAPFFSVEMYREFFKPYHKVHCDIAHEIGAPIERHDCGHCEAFIPDWLEMGVRSWNPAQTSNDLVGIKKKYQRNLAIVGGWDAIKYDRCTDMEEYRQALVEYVDALAPGGGFVFSARTGNTPVNDPYYEQRTAILKDVYENYARDYYKTH